MGLGSTHGVVLPPSSADSTSTHTSAHGKLLNHQIIGFEGSTYRSALQELDFFHPLQGTNVIQNGLLWIRKVGLDAKFDQPFANLIIQHNSDLLFISLVVLSIKCCFKLHNLFVKPHKVN